MKQVVFLTSLSLISVFVCRSQGIYHDINPDWHQTWAMHTLDIDFDGDGGNDVQIAYDFIGIGLWINVNALEGASISGEGNHIDALDFMDTIDSGLTWGDAHSMFVDEGSPWNFSTKMAAVRITKDEGDYYGWVRMGLDGSNPNYLPSEFTVYEYGFNPIVDEPIYAAMDAIHVASDLAAEDGGDNKNGLDLHVAFNKALFEDGVAEYRLMAVKEESTDTFDVQTVMQLSPGNYMSLTPTGNNWAISFKENSRDTDGSLIGNLQPYRVFVASILPGSSGDSCILSNPSASIELKTVAAPVSGINGSDVGDFGDGRDLIIEFDNIPDETTILEYRVFLVDYFSQNSFTLEVASGLSEGYYTTAEPSGGPVSIQFNEEAVDTEGHPITSGSYRVFVMSVADGSATDTHSMASGEDLTGLRKTGENWILAGGQAPDVEFMDIVPDTVLSLAGSWYAMIEFDLNHDSILDCSFHLEVEGSPWNDYYTLGMGVYNGGEAVIGPLGLNAPLVDKLDWVQGGGLLAKWSSISSQGPWYGVGNPHYIAFRFEADGDSIQAWLRTNGMKFYEYGWKKTYASGVAGRRLNAELFPNPVSDQLFIKMPDGEEISRLALFSLDGRELYSTRGLPGSSSMDMKPYPPGIYLVRFVIDEVPCYRKIVKQ